MIILQHLVKTKGTSSGIIAEIVETEMGELLPQKDIREWLNVRESLTGTNLKNFFMCKFLNSEFT